MACDLKSGLRTHQGYGHRCVTKPRTSVAHAQRTGYSAPSTRKEVGKRSVRVLARSPGGDSNDYKEQARLLTKLFYGSQTAEEGTAPQNPHPDIALHIPALPLWRVQWAMLPGMQQVLHIHAPHYVHMFEALLSRPRPWYFGHVYLPFGSDSLGSPQFALRPGSKAPLVGVLMEVTQALRLNQGKFLIVATGVTRIKVTNSIQEVPYSCADVEVLPDYEEVSSVTQGCSDSALMYLEDGTDIQLAMQACEMVGKVSAVASSSCWMQEYELVIARQNQWDDVEPREPRNQLEMELLVRDMLACSREFVPLPDGPVVGRWDIAEVARRAEERLEEAAKNFDTEAFLMAEKHKGAQALGASMYGRGLVPDVGLDSSAWMEDKSGDLISAVLKLEQAVWRELDAVAALAMKVHRSRLSMPLGLLQLRPPPASPASNTKTTSLHPAKNATPTQTPQADARTVSTALGGGSASMTAPSGPAASADTSAFSSPSSGDVDSDSDSDCESVVPTPSELVASAAASALAMLSTGDSDSDSGSGSTEPTSSALDAAAEAASSSADSLEPYAFQLLQTAAPDGQDTAEPGQGAAASGQTTAASGQSTAASSPSTAASGRITALSGQSTAASGQSAGTTGHVTASNGQTSADTSLDPPQPAASAGPLSPWPSTTSAPTKHLQGENLAAVAAAQNDAVSSKYDMMASEGLDLHADPGYPVYRRAQRLSYAVVAAMLAELGAERWQQLLEVPCTAQRLKLVLHWLRRQRNLFAAIAAVKGLQKPSAE